jgi:peptidoglycan hydrolase CwlO-like protein
MVGDNPVAEPKDLKHKAAELRKEKQELNRALRNAQRRNKRLNEKAKQLSDADLLSVMLMRRDKKARLDELAGAQAAAASAAAGAAGPADVEVVAPGTSSERPHQHMQGEAGGRP